MCDYVQFGAVEQAYILSALTKALSKSMFYAEY